MPTRTRIIAEARAFIGTPYRHQASLKGVGCDCLGLVRGVWRAVYGDEPEQRRPTRATGRRQAASNTSRKPRSGISCGASEGDLSAATPLASSSNETRDVLDQSLFAAQSAPPFYLPAAGSRCEA